MNTKHVYLTSDSDFIRIAQSSSNISQALRRMGLSAKGGNYKTLENRCKNLGIKIPKQEFTENGLTEKTRIQKEIRNNTSDSTIIELCKRVQSRSAVLKLLGLKPGTSNNIIWINSKITTLSIDISHWTGQGHLSGKTHGWSPRIPLEEIFRENSTISSSKLKERILKENLLDYKCLVCGISSWNNFELSLHLDHINGNSNDNRLENLRLLCPNCHSQTTTYCRKKPSFKPKEKVTLEQKTKKAQYENLGQPTKKKQYYCACGTEINIKSAQCNSCRGKSQEKITWPSDTELIELISKFNYLELGRQLGVSDNAIRHRLRRRGIVPPYKHEPKQEILDLIDS